MMDTLHDRIRQRAYELWQQAGETGDPEDHWRQAERELTAGLSNRPEATTDEATPGETVAAGGADAAGTPGKNEMNAGAPSAPSRVRS